MTGAKANLQSLRVVVTGGVETRYHHFDDVGPPLDGIVLDAGARSSRVPIERLLQGDFLGHCDALVSITTGGSLGPAEEALLLGSIARAGNDRGRPVHFLGIHGACCSFANSERYFEMLGGRFVSHGPIQPIEVLPASSDHPVVRGIKQFVVRDELYRLELCAEVEPLLVTREADSNATLPLAWARRFGEGKVCYLALGHGRAQLTHPSVARFIIGALTWFAAD